LIGLVPMIADKPAAKTAQPPQWTVVGTPVKPPAPAPRKLEVSALTIDAEFNVIEQPRLLPGEDPRWGR
jgi:hypothetical protein